MDSDLKYSYQYFEELCKEEIRMFDEMDQLFNHVSSLIQRLPNKHIEDKETDIRFVTKILSLMKWKDGSMRWRNK